MPRIGNLVSYHEKITINSRGPLLPLRASHFLCVSKSPFNVFKPWTSWVWVFRWWLMCCDISRRRSSLTGATWEWHLFLFFIQVLRVKPLPYALECSRGCFGVYARIEVENWVRETKGVTVTWMRVRLFFMGFRRLESQLGLFATLTVLSIKTGDISLSLCDGWWFVPGRRAIVLSRCG